ncbi:alkali metal cation/H+ antiporter Nha1 C terminus-domain-containing protein [Usnea florida]
MVWEQLSINKPHWAYLIIGGFTSLFMLVSLFVKEKLYIGEATVATICGVIFGPHAANLFNPLSWGNTDQITLECSRVVLVVQCFAVGVELPKAYMERHWRSVVFLLVPVMTFGWLITSLFIWWMITPLSWLESLMCAACVTATDPVLASSVVGKGKFAKRVPKHLRDLLSAESGCNDGMAFPFIYLSFYLIHYRPNANEVAFHWFCETILYECVFGATYGVLIGYFGRHMIKWADRRGLIDRESFLVFYFVLALFCAGTGATLGTDDLLVGFAAGVGFSNDGWFTEKTEESHVSNVIDLLLNLAYFVYLGSVIPWEQYNAPQFGLTPWRLVVIAIFVIFFRRIPIMMALKPVIPDIKTWREALFAGHFGPIGVGAIFAAILARAELETDTTTPLGVLPENPDTENYLVVQIIWPLTTFLVITSILVHGSSIAVFTLGKRINTLTLTMSYTQANEEGPSWMNRLPRIQSTAKASMSKSKDEMASEESLNEKPPEFAPGTLPPIGIPGNFLRRQKEEDTPIEKPRPTRRKSRWESGMGPGGPISQSAITPQRRTGVTSPDESVSDTLNEKDSPSGSTETDEPPDQLEMEDAQEKREKKERRDGTKETQEPEVEAYEEGDDLVVEDEEGEIIGMHNVKGKTEDQKRQLILDDEEALRKDTSGQHAKGKFHPHTGKTEGDELEQTFSGGAAHPGQTSRSLLKRLGTGWDGWKGKDRDGRPSDPKPEPKPKAPEHKRGPAHAYQFGNTIIVEDEDGEVVKKYDLPPQPKQRRGVRGGVQDGPGHFTAKPMLKRAGTWVGLGGKAEGTAGNESEAEASGQGKKGRKQSIVDPDDDRIRFSVSTGGRRLSKADFIKQIQSMDPKARVEAVEESDVPEVVKQEVRADAAEESGEGRSVAKPRSESKDAMGRPAMSPVHEGDQPDEEMPMVRRFDTVEDRPRGPDGLTLVDSNKQEIPFHPVSDSVQKYGGEETAAQRRRRLALTRKDSDDDGTERVPPKTSGPQLKDPVWTTGGSKAQDSQDGETAAERRRRLAALGEGDEGEQVDSSDSEDDGGERRPAAGQTPLPEPGVNEERRPPGVRFAVSPAGSQGRVQWGEGVGRKGRG